jgi:hypothetical protein
MKEVGALEVSIALFIAGVNRSSFKRFSAWTSKPKKTITVAVAEADGEVRSLGTIANREESIRKLIRKRPRRNRLPGQIHPGLIDPKLWKIGLSHWRSSCASL